LVEIPCSKPSEQKDQSETNSSTESCLCETFGESLQTYIYIPNCIHRSFALRKQGKWFNEFCIIARLLCSTYMCLCSLPLKLLNVNAKALSIENNELDGGSSLFLHVSNTFIAKSDQSETPLVPKAGKITIQCRRVDIM